MPFKVRVTVWPTSASVVPLMMGSTSTVLSLSDPRSAALNSPFCEPVTALPATLVTLMTGAVVSNSTGLVCCTAGVPALLLTSALRV